MKLFTLICGRLAHGTFILGSVGAPRSLVAWFFSIALLLTLVPSGAAHPASSGDDYVLTIIHTNDQHSAYGGFTPEGRLCYEAWCEGGQGGAVRLKQAVSAVKRDDPEALFLDAGDIFQGSLYWVTHKEAMPSAIMKYMDYDAVTAGNHEFDDGCSPFLRLISSLPASVVDANLSFECGPQNLETATGTPLPSSEKITPWTIIEKRGRKIAVIGLTTVDTVFISLPCAEARFEDETRAMRRAVSEVSARGADIVVALTHIGLENDKRLARAVPGVDVIVGGHSHSLLSNRLEKAEGPYPVVEKSPEGKPVLIVSAFCHLRYLGRLEVAFNASGDPVRWQGEPIALDEPSLKVLNAPLPDAELAGIIDAYSEPVREMKKSFTGEIRLAGKDGGPLEENGIRQCRRRECLTGNIVADALLNGVFEEAEAAIINSGALRASLREGAVTVGDVLDVLPFTNIPVLAHMPGHVLLAALEHSASRYVEGVGAFLQISGLRYALDARKPVGGRVQKAEIRGRDGEWRAVRPDESYWVATVDFLAKGGDGYAMFKSLRWQEAQISHDQTLVDYLARHSPLTQVAKDRIDIVNGF